MWCSGQLLLIAVPRCTSSVALSVLFRYNFACIYLNAPCLCYVYVCVWRFRIDLVRQFVEPVNINGTVQLCSLLQSVFLLPTLCVFELPGSFRLWGGFTVLTRGSNVKVMSAWRRASEVETR